MYHLKENQNNDKVLFINGKEAFCPFAQPIKVPNSVGGIGIMRLPCQSGCPHFETRLTDDSGEFCEVQISCTAKTKSFTAKVESIQKPVSPLLVK